MIDPADQQTLRAIATTCIGAGIPYVSLTPTEARMVTSTGVEVLARLNLDGTKNLLIDGEEHSLIPWPPNNDPATLGALLLAGRSLLGL